MSASEFKPPWWLRNRHVQSCYGSLMCPKSKTELRWEELTLPDGDFVDICWAGPSAAPIVVLLHGLEGSVYSHYIQVTTEALVEKGWQVVILNYRTCSGRLNRLPRSYNGGDISDFAYLIEVIQQRFPTLPITAIGFSLGGNILLRYMALQPNPALVAGVGVSVPYDLALAADYLLPVYQRHLLRTMKRKAIEKIYLGHVLPAKVDEIKWVDTLREFDELLTAPLFGFDSVDHYYREASCSHLVSKVKRPMLILHSLDDPFIPPYSIPEKSKLSPSLQIELLEQGGHVGFISGGWPWNPEYWLLGRISRYLQNYMN